jgi:serine/threonine protein kinase
MKNHVLLDYLEKSVLHQGLDQTIRKSISDHIKTLILHPKPLPKTSTNHRFGLNPSNIELSNQNINNQNSENAKFDILRVLGVGGMGTVYEGLQKSLNRSVAIKKSKGDLDFLPQIYHEAQITAFLDHPNILTMHDFGIDQDGLPIQIMKKINGINWSTLLYDHKNAFWQDLHIQQDEDAKLLFHLDILTKVSQALDYAHENHVIHRDLKPENIMIGKFGEVFVLDWGIAIYVGPQEDIFIAQKQSNLKNTLVGTPAYMAPEQLEINQVATTMTDVYLLGAILYEITHLQCLHQGNTIEEVFEHISNNQIPTLAPYLNHELKSLIYDSLHSNPQKRPINAHQFKKRLQQAIYSFKSRQLEIKGIKTLDKLKNTLTDPMKEELLDDYFDRARHYLKGSLDLFEKNTIAQNALQELLSLWIDRCIQRREFRSAYRYLKELPIYEVEIEIAINEAQNQLELEKKELERLKIWQENQSIQKSQKPRIYFALFCFIFLSLGSVMVYILSLSGQYQDSAQWRFYTALILTSMAVIFSEWTFYFKAQKEQLNQAFQNFRYLLYSVFISVTLARFVGWQYHNQSHLLILHEMPLISFACFASSILMRKTDFLLGGIVFAICSVFAIFFPNQILLFYAIAQFVLWFSILLIWTFKINLFSPSNNRSHEYS